MKNNQKINTELTSRPFYKAALNDTLHLLIFDLLSHKLKAFSSNSANFLPILNNDAVSLTNILDIEEELLKSVTPQGFRIVESTKNGKHFFAILTADLNHLYVHIQQDIRGQKTLSSQINILNYSHQLTQYSNLQSLLAGFLNMIKSIIPFDSLLIQQFDKNRNWQVIASNSSGKIPPFDKMFFPATDLPQNIHAILDKGMPYLANNLNNNFIDILGEVAVNLDYIITSTPGEYTKQLWHNMGLESTALFPIIIDNKIWGTIAGMHKKPIALSLEKVSAIMQMTYFLSTQLQIRLLKQNTPLEEKLNSLNKLRDTLIAYDEIEKAITEKNKSLISLLDASGISLFIGNKPYHYGVTPPTFIIEEIQHNLLDNQEEYCYKTNNLASEIPELQSFKNHISGLVSVRISDRNKDKLVWYRINNTKVIQWAGNPIIDENNQIARNGFDPWVEVKTGLSKEWTTKEIGFIKEIGKLLKEVNRNQNQLVIDYENNLKLVFEHSTDLIAILNEDFSVRYMSDVTARLFGINLTKEEHNWKELVHPDDLEKIKSYLQRVKNGESVSNGIEYRIKNSKGNYIYLETFASNYLENPLLKGILCNSRNITPKINALKGLYKFQRIIETANSAVLIIDTKREAYPIIYANEGIYHFTNRKREAVVGRSWQLINSFIEETKNAKTFRKAIETGTSIETTLKMKVANKDTIWVRAQLSHFEINNDSQWNDLVIIFSDITSEVDAKEKLKEYSEKLHISNEELQTFAYVASHDLQEPLRTISGFSELFAEIYQDKIDEEANEYLSFILQATGRMKKLINDLLHFSRLSTEKGFITEIDVANILGKATDNLHTLIEENKAIITHDLLPNIFVNETLLLQVFQNLISNAIKYRSDEQPKIHITANREKQNWIFGVEDNGIGISKRYFERIFIIFQRLHTTDKYSGTGIGLAICKKIIEKYGGRIWVESEEGKGSTFYFTIPDVLTLA